MKWQLFPYKNSQSVTTELVKGIQDVFYILQDYVIPQDIVVVEQIFPLLFVYFFNLFLKHIVFLILHIGS